MPLSAVVGRNQNFRAHRPQLFFINQVLRGAGAHEYRNIRRVFQKFRAKTVKGRYAVATRDQERFSLLPRFKTLPQRPEYIQNVAFRFGTEKRRAVSHYLI